MEVERRSVLRLLAAAFAGPGLAALMRGRGFAQSGGNLALRSVAAADAAGLQAIMNMCVAGEAAFHGKCGEWSRDWATDLTVRCPHRRRAARKP
jgi:hypothetical protein